MNPKKFILITLLTILAIRLEQIIFLLFFRQTRFYEIILIDPFHHYQLGILLILIGWWLRQTKPHLKIVLLAIGSGLVIDESMFLFRFLAPDKINHKSPLGILIEAIIFLLFSLMIFYFNQPKKKPKRQKLMFEEKYIRVNDVKIRYFDEGKGSAIVLIHGLGGSAVNWFKNIKQLSQKHRVIVPDLPSFGKSEIPEVDPDDVNYDFFDRVSKRLSCVIGNQEDISRGKLNGWSDCH